MLNPTVVARQMLDTAAVKAIEAEHERMDAHIAAMNDLASDDPALVGMARDLEAIEFRMQELWGFERLAAMHTHWSRPRACRCDRRFNAEMWRNGVRARAISPECRLHAEDGYRSPGVVYAEHVRPGAPKVVDGDLSALPPTSPKPGPSKRMLRA